MSAQIGYFDSLKSVAGKVFNYLASITLDGTDGKTITVTQDTALDEAVAMSSKAPKESPTFTGTVTAPTILQTNAIENESKLLQTEDIFSAFVVTGLLPATSANLISDISAGHAYVTGTRVNKAVTSKTYTASKDTYVDINSAGTYTFVEVALAAAAPAVTADSIRLAKVVTDATAITGVTDLRNLVLTGIIPNQKISGAMPSIELAGTEASAASVKIQEDAGFLKFIRVSDGVVLEVIDIVNGRRGIGTTGPTSPLHVEKSVADGSYVATIKNTGPGSGLYIYNADWDATDYLLYADNGGSNKFVVQGTGNVCIGSVANRATTAGTKILNIFDGTAPAGTLADGCSIYSTTGELYVMDAAGNATLQSPHPKEVLDKTDISIPLPWGYHSKNAYLGREVLLDWSALVAEVENLSKKKFAIYRDLPVGEKLNWNDDQTRALINQKMEEEVEVAAQDAIENVEVTENVEVESGTFETKYRLDSESGKIVSENFPVTITKEQGTGKFEYRQKTGYRLDEKTGKMYRKKTEVESRAEITAIPAPPEWMRKRIA